MTQINHIADFNKSYSSLVREATIYMNAQEYLKYQRQCIYKLGLEILLR